MFKPIKGGYVRVQNGGRVRTMSLATFASEPALYASLNSNWHSVLLSSGKTRHGYSWDGLHLPPGYNRIKDTAHGVLQVECVATKVKKRLGLDK